MRIIILAVTIIAFTFSCKSKKVNVTNEPVSNPYEFSILFGSGGGFTGKYDNYELRSDGKLYKLKEESSDELMKTLSRAQRDTIFNETKKLSIETKDINQPGNMTHYLGIKKQGKEHKVIWGQPGTPPPDNVQEVYTKLNELLR